MKVSGVSWLPTKGNAVTPNVVTADADTTNAHKLIDGHTHTERDRQAHTENTPAVGGAWRVPPTTKFVHTCTRMSNHGRICINASMTRGGVSAPSCWRAAHPRNSPTRKTAVQITINTQTRKQPNAHAPDELSMLPSVPHATQMRCQRHERPGAVEPVTRHLQPHHYAAVPLGPSAEQT